MFCSSCGKQTPDSAQFCMSCGAYLTPPSPAGAATGGGFGAPPAAGPPAGSSSGAAVSFSAPYAGFWMRFLAHFIDRILLTVVVVILCVPIGLFLGIASAAGNLAEDIIGGIAVLLWVPLGVVIDWLYDAGFTSSARQATPGKMALNLVVTDERGVRISFGRATGRYFGKVLSGIILWIGYLVQPFTEKRQALHDLLAGTLVMRR